MADQATTTTTPEPLVGPPPPTVTPLDPPVVVYNQIWRVAPLVIDTQEQLDALDPNEWMQNPPTEQPGPPQFPKIYYNVNVVPRIVNDADEAKALGGEWREFSLTQAVVTAAQAALDAAKTTAKQ